MKLLVSLKLTSDANMVTDVAGLRGAVGAGNLHVFTDRPYRTELDGVQYHYLPAWMARIPGARIGFRFLAILRLARRFRVDAIVGYHMYSSGIPAWFAGRLLGLPVVVYVLGKDLDQDYRRPVVGGMLRFFLRRVDGITVQGQSSLQALAPLGTPVAVVPPVIDLSRIPAPLPDRSIDLIFVGRLSSEKRCDRFLEVVRVLREKRPGLRAQVVGTGPLADRLRSQASDLGLNETVAFTGWSSDVYGQLCNARIYVLSSDNDQMPLTLLEAMACGCVPVVGRVGNVADLVSPETGSVVEKSDVPAYVAACLELLEHPESIRRKRETGWSRIQDYSIESGARRWETLLSRLADPDRVRKQ